MATIQYITQPGERWDIVSQKMYGTPFEVERLVRNNPNIPVKERLDGGLVLEVEVLDDNNVQINKNLLPPWKR